MSTGLPPSTRDEIIARARKWVAAEVPYSMTSYGNDGYRQDCSGFVSMVWNLGRNEWTGSLGGVAEPISREQLQPGDILLFHDPAAPRQGSHVVVFGGWTDTARTTYTAYETTRPRTREQITPYPYWNNTGHYVPYRYKGLTFTTADTNGAADGRAAHGVSGAVANGPDGGAEARGAAGEREPAREREPAGGTEAGSAAAPVQGVTPAVEEVTGRVPAAGPGVAAGPGSTPGEGLAPVQGVAPAVEEVTGRVPAAGPGATSELGAALGEGATPVRGAASGQGTAPGHGLAPGQGAAPAAERAADRNSGAGARPAAASPPYPGARRFGPGADNIHVMRWGRMLVERGGARFYASGPGSRWTDADRRATRAFQRAQGWTGSWANGMPTPLTWTYLVEGRGRDIPPEALEGPPGRVVGPTVRPSSHGVPGYPGRGMFRPGVHNAHVTELGEQLVRKGFGRHYTSGPGPLWGEEDRRNVEEFQRSQGWRGGAADGCPGPETWRRLFT